MGAKLLENDKLVIICNNDKKQTGGAYSMDLSQEKEAHPQNAITKLTDDPLDLMEISKCGRMIIFLGPCFL
jgi:hypothetical protein